MPHLGSPPRRNKHFFTGPALGLVFSGISLIMGVHGVLEARNNPTPAVHSCRDGLVAELGPDAWIDVSECEPDLDNSVLMFDDRGGEALFVALVDPLSGAQAGILRVDDPVALKAIDAAEREPEGPPSETASAASAVLFATPRTGMTARVDSTEREILTKGLRGLGEDEPVLELGETPHPTRSLVFLVLGVLGLAGSTWGVQRAKAAKAREEAKLAAWRAAGNSPTPHNPFTV